MALTDIVFDQANTFAAERGNIGVIENTLSNSSLTTFIRGGVLQRWNANLSQWEVFPLRYRDTDGWV